MQCEVINSILKIHTILNEGTLEKDTDTFQFIKLIFLNYSLMQEQTSNVVYTAMKIEGMSCNSCVQHIESSVFALSGIYYIRVSLQQRKADIFYAGGQITPEAISETITDAGFDVQIINNQNITAGKD